MAAGATVFRDTPIFVVPAGVRVTSQNYVVADGVVIRGSLTSAILAGVPLTSRNLHRCRRQSYPPQLRIPYSGGCSRRVTSRVLRSTGRRGHPPQRYISHSSTCFCGLQEITSLQTTVARSYSKYGAVSVMRTMGWDVNGIHVSTIRNLIRREGSD
jgi:hypothetical protein